MNPIIYYELQTTSKRGNVSTLYDADMKRINRLLDLSHHDLQSYYLWKITKTGDKEVRKLIEGGDVESDFK